MTAPVKPEVGIDALERLDIRVGTIVTVEDVPDSKKLVGIVPVLAVPQEPVPDGARLG